jgi:hypothetical protein
MGVFMATTEFLSKVSQSNTDSQSLENMYTSLEVYQASAEVILPFGIPNVSP